MNSNLSKRGLPWLGYRSSSSSLYDQSFKEEFSIHICLHWFLPLAACIHPSPAIVCICCSVFHCSFYVHKRSILWQSLPMCLLPPSLHSQPNSILAPLTETYTFDFCNFLNGTAHYSLDIYNAGDAALQSLWPGSEFLLLCLSKGLCLTAVGCYWEDTSIEDFFLPLHQLHQVNKVIFILYFYVWALGWSFTVP